VCEGPENTLRRGAGLRAQVRLRNRGELVGVETSRWHCGKRDGDYTYSWGRIESCRDAGGALRASIGQRLANQQVNDQADKR